MHSSINRLTGIKSDETKPQEEADGEDKPNYYMTTEARTNSPAEFCN